MCLCCRRGPRRTYPKHLLLVGYKGTGVLDRHSLWFSSALGEGAREMHTGPHVSTAAVPGLRSIMCRAFSTLFSLRKQQHLRCRRVMIDAASANLHCQNYQASGAVYSTLAGRASVTESASPSEDTATDGCMRCGAQSY